MTLSPQLIERLTSLPGLPSPPRAALRIIELARSPEATLPEVARVVNCDPALAARMLRVANSSQYGRGRKCENLRQALVMLGMNATLTIALSFSLVNTLRRNAATGMDYKRFWQRSLLAAVAARALGDFSSRKDGENLFLASLLQDIGMLAVDLLEPEVYASADVAIGDHDAVPEIERAALGATHVEIGEWLLRRWNMPDYVPAVVSMSHSMESASHGGALGAMSRCVALSGLAADIWMREPRGEALQQLALRAEELLDMDATDVGIVLAQVRERVPEAEALFEFPLLDGQRMQQVLDEALEMVLLGNLCALKEASALLNVAIDNGDSRLSDVRRGVSTEQLLEEASSVLEGASPARSAGKH